MAENGGEIVMSEGKLTTKQLKLLNAMFTESSFAAACKKAGIGQRTGERYRSLPLFVEECESMKRQLFEQSSNRLRELSSESISVLESILNDENSTNSDKIRVAKMLLDNSFRVVEDEDIIKRLDNIEKRQEKVLGG